MPNEKDFQLPFLHRDMLNFEHATTIDLELLTAADTAIALDLTGMTREGQFRYNKTAAATSLLESTIFNLPDIPIWLTLKYTGGGQAPNQVYAAVYLRVNKVRTQLLCQGALSPYYGINWPNQAPHPPMQLRGALTLKGGTNPAAGLEASLTVPAGEFWLVKMVMVPLSTNATVANRRVTLEIIPTPGITFFCPTPVVQTASQSITYSWWPGSNIIDNSAAFEQAAPLPHDLLLPPQARLQTFTLNKQAGDDYDAMGAYVEKFFLSLT